MTLQTIRAVFWVHSRAQCIVMALSYPFARRHMRRWLPCKGTTNAPFLAARMRSNTCIATIFSSGRASNSKRQAIVESTHHLRVRCASCSSIAHTPSSHHQCPSTRTCATLSTPHPQYLLPRTRASTLLRTACALRRLNQCVTISIS